ncbi:hypothetical protein HK101_010124 [Irineochytrium annulatum]|nr:hypothetical protein HK101_010124 [Irineochytrium annulatum]
MSPTGGKTNPGFREFVGKSCTDLIDWLLDRAIEPPLGGRGRKKLDAGVALRFLVDVANRVIELEMQGRKDDVDEALLRGLDLTGQVVRGKIVIPRHLRSDYNVTRGGSGEADENDIRQSADACAGGDTGSAEGAGSTGEKAAGTATGSPWRIGVGLGGRRRTAASDSGAGAGSKSKSPPRAPDADGNVDILHAAVNLVPRPTGTAAALLSPALSEPILSFG